MIEIWAKLRGLWARQKGTWRHHVHLHAFLTTALDVSDQPEAPESSTQEKGHRFPLRGQTGHKAGLGVFGEQEISWEFGSFKKKTMRGLQIYSHVQQCSFYLWEWSRSLGGPKIR